MTKKRLTTRQQQRIRKNQAEKAENVSSSEAGEEDCSGFRQKCGLVIACYGRHVDIQPVSSDYTWQDTAIIRCNQRANLPSLVTGDHVVWHEDNTGDSGVVVARLDRRSEFNRPAPAGKLKTVAANIDQIVVVIACEPLPHRNLIDRYLVASEITEIKPVILLNKADLPDRTQLSELDELIESYKNIGYDCHKVSALSENGIAEFKTVLSGHTSVLVGQSGVGKSSLINALIPDASAKVGSLSEQMRKGTHTTTTSTLFQLPAGGMLIDSPGIREFSLTHANAESVLHAFREFRPFIGLCRFRDCRHSGDPGCALSQAAELGKISSARMQSYQQIVNSL